MFWGVVFIADTWSKVHRATRQSKKKERKKEGKTPVDLMAHPVTADWGDVFFPRWSRPDSQRHLLAAGVARALSAAAQRLNHEATSGPKTRRPPDPSSSDDMNVHVWRSHNLMAVSLFSFIPPPPAPCPLTAGRCCWSASWWRPAGPGTSRRSDAGWSSGSPAPEGPRCQTAPAAADGDKDGQGFFFPDWVATFWFDCDEEEKKKKNLRGAQTLKQLCG